MKFNSVFLSTLLIFSVVQMGVSTSVLAFEQNSNERWFEVEVILFKQLGDKKLLKEQFPDNVNASNLPQYSQSFDLLTEYLQPNLSHIKQFIPHCGQSNEQAELLTSLVDRLFPNALAPLKSLTEQHIATFNNKTPAIESDLAPQSKQALAEQTLAEQTLAEQTLTEQTLTEQTLTEQTLTEQTLTEQALATQFKKQQEALAQPIFSNFSAQGICIIPQDKMKEIFTDKRLANTNPDAFDVESLPSRLNAAGIHRSQPYLIADESLLLKDIGQSLRWSKEFRPLLHFGWRQVGLTQSKAIPLKLIAGSNLMHQYKQALNEYQRQLNQEQTLAPNALNELTPAQQTAQLSKINKPVNTTANKQHLFNDIFININKIDENTLAATAEQLNTQTLENVLAVNTSEAKLNDAATAQNKTPAKTPTAPLQPWFLEGFFKVHLDHYLYITADFNVLNNEPATSTNPHGDKSELKLINFNQNRRVITGEVHYFDHPYIGMIVQIRRFDPSKPADEAVSQAVKH